MTDDVIRQEASRLAVALATNPESIINPQNSFELLTLANEIFDFIKNGTVPAAP